jgi:hypothetical protein
MYILQMKDGDRVVYEERYLFKICMYWGWLNLAAFPVINPYTRYGYKFSYYKE